MAKYPDSQVTEAYTSVDTIRNTRLSVSWLRFFLVGIEVHSNTAKNIYTRGKTLMIDLEVKVKQGARSGFVQVIQVCIISLQKFDHLPHLSLTDFL